MRVKKISKLEVFGASSFALVLSALLAVIFGNQISAYISPEELKVSSDQLDNTLNGSNDLRRLS